MTSHNWQLRWAEASDYVILADVMFDAVRNGRSHYTEEQRSAWVPARRGGPEWDERLRIQDVILTVSESAVVGFMSLARGGYIDFAYIRPGAQGNGLLRLMYEQLLNRARERGEGRLWVHASLMAQPAFRALGFRVVLEETISIGDQALERALMEIELS